MVLIVAKFMKRFCVAAIWSVFPFQLVTATQSAPSIQLASHMADNAIVSKELVLETVQPAFLVSTAFLQMDVNVSMTWHFKIVMFEANLHRLLFS